MKIKVLSRQNVKEAVDLLVEVFNPLETDADDPRKWLPASLAPEKHKSLYSTFNITFLKYYAAIDEKSKKVIGISGIYSIKEDEKDSDWLAWFCVHPEFRGKGIGSKMLASIIQKAKNRNKKFIKLYTSKNKFLESALKLYKKFNFKTFKTETNKKGEKVAYLKKEI